MRSYNIDIRPRRQATFPSSLLQTLGIEIGDSIKVEILGKKAILVPQKKAALDALAEIQKIFSGSKISENEMLSSLNKGRKA